MGGGRPVVATTTGGIVELIVNGESGLLVPPGDCRSLAEAMARLVDDAGLRVRLAAGAQDRVKGFTASAVVERLEAVYARVASPAGRASVSALSPTTVAERQGVEQ